MRRGGRGPGPLQGEGAQAAPAEDRWVVLAAMGDLMLAGEWDEVAGEGGLGRAFHDLVALCRQGNVVFANLETTLDAGAGLIPKQPRVVGAESTVAEALDLLGVDVVNLANNHAFDAYAEGFEAVRRLLDDRGIHHFGAGRDGAEAAHSLVLEHRGVRFGWLGYAAPDTRPSHLAGPGRPGINPLREEAACEEVHRLRRRVDHVVVSLHWGVEYCHLPAPDQIRLGRKLVEQGASLVIGHHAHVIQGGESFGGGYIAYNLGNATTTDFRIDGRLAIRQTRRSRSSVILKAAFSKERLEVVEMVPIRCARGAVLVDDRHARRILERANRRLRAGVTPWRWRGRRLYEDLVLRTARKLHPRVIRSVRLRHLGRFCKNFSHAIRGQGPA